MKFTLEISLDNAAFHDEEDDMLFAGEEVQRILSNLGMQHRDLSGTGPLHDSNGNTVGKWEVSA